MLKFYRPTLCKVGFRYISQFPNPKKDCCTIKPREIIDPNKCIIRDGGLVLGVYCNDDVITASKPILTPSAKKYDAMVNGKLMELLKLSPTPRLGECRVFYDLDPKFAYVAVAGLGSECLDVSECEKMDEGKEAVRVAAATGTQALQDLAAVTISVESMGHADAAAEGAHLGCWEFTKYRTRARRIHFQPTFTLYDDCSFNAWEMGSIKAEAQNVARYLQELPANILNPTAFANMCVQFLCELNINVEVRTEGWAKSHNMGGLVAMGDSSAQPPLFVELSYYGTSECENPVVLVGKGATFNSGGIDLKSYADLLHMKGDMAGAACAVGVIRAAALLNLPINIRALLPLCEIMPNGNSPKFGDVVVTAAGKSVEIRRPSLEDRLLVADSLVYGRTYSPKLMMDIGTMSKELRDSLGACACGAYSNDEDLYSILEKASMNTGDRVWRMPLWNYYGDQVKDSVRTDCANTGKNNNGESPNCAGFLREFVCDSRWVHLDTYNVAYTKGFDYPYLRRGMTGRPTRTIIDFLYNLVLQDEDTDENNEEKSSVCN